MSKDDELQTAYESILMFIASGHQAKLLKKETIDYLDEFGPDGFFKKDLYHIVKFTDTIVKLMDKIEERQSLQAQLFKADS